MKREIKFRVWDIELHMWINNIGMGKDNTLAKGTEKRFCVMQYTGIKDKNGKEIYEGDILTAKPKESNWNPLVCKMAFNANTARFEAQQYWPNKNAFLSLSNNHDYYEYEVCGNIYENPELLKSGQQTSINS